MKITSRALFSSLSGTVTALTLVWGLGLATPASGQEVPQFKRQCADLLIPPDGILEHFEYTIPMVNSKIPVYARPSQRNLVSHSHFNWLLRRTNLSENVKAAEFKKMTRQKITTVGGQLGMAVTEQTWSHLHENVLSLSQGLFEANLDQFTPEEKRLVQQIFGVMYLKQGLQFVSEKERPGIFEQTGPHRLAVTGSTPGSTIYINDSYTNLFDLHDNKDKFTSSIDGMGTQTETPVRASISNLAPLVEAAKKEQMANLLGLLIHEFGHHLGIKDTADRPLDQIGSKFEKLALAAMQEVDLSLINQPWIRLRTLNIAAPSATAPEGKFYFVEPGDLYDLTAELKSRTAEVLGIKISKIWTYNLRIEGLGTFDHAEFATPVSMLADVVALAEDGSFTTVPVRLVSYISPSQPMRFLRVAETWWQYSNGQLKKSGDEALLSVEILKSEAKPGVEMQPPTRIDLVAAGFARAEYRAGETAQFHIELPPMESADLNSLVVELSSDNFVQSGGIKKMAFHLSPVSVQKLANGNSVVAFQWVVPGNVKRTLRMRVRRITTKVKNEAVTFRAAKELGFTIPGGKSQAKLLSYGNEMHRIVEVIRVYPQPFLGFRLPMAAAIPLEYRFKGGSPLSIKLTGTVGMQAHTASENSGFVIELMAKELHPLLESREIQRQGDEVIVRIRFRVAKVYNQHPVQQVMITSVYFMDQSLDEVFENALIGIKIE